MRYTLLSLLALAACSSDPEHLRETESHPTSQALVIDATITTTADEVNADGDCSLREAVRAAFTHVAVDQCPAGPTAPDRLRLLLSAATYTLSIPGADENQALTGDLDLPNAIEIVGQGSAQTVIDGGDLDRVLHAMGGNIAHEIILQGLTIRNGCANGGTCVASGAGGYPAAGGGMYHNSSSQLSMLDVVFEASHAASGGGLAICASVIGVAALENVVVRNNLANLGGGVEAHVPWTCTSCTFTNNSAAWGGGLSQYAAEATLVDSIVGTNTATGGGGGGLLARGTYMGATSGAITMIGGTLQANTATASGGGVYAGPRGTWEPCSVSSPCRVTLQGVQALDGVADAPGGQVGSGGNVAQGAGGLVEASGTTSIANGSDLSSPYAPDCSGELHLYDQSTLANATGCTVYDHRPPPGPVCGNVVTESPEQCDGSPCCSSSCTFEAATSPCSDGDACTPDDACDGAGTCVPAGSSCGNGSTQSSCGEECDDGNLASHDGCSSNCLIEACTAWE